jgi:type VI secretion system protein ImpG
MMRDELLLYYERELDYLRKSAVQFAEKYPKVASRLVLEPTKCEDPHVERMLEAFAFLAARVHLKMDDDFPEISEALLTVIYPQLTRPIPSMSVVEFQLDPEKGKLSTGFSVPRDTVLQSKPVGGVPCTFRTCYASTLWPITVEAAEWQSPSRMQPPVKAADSPWAIRLSLRCAPDISMGELDVERLRFYLDGESSLVNTVYELLLSRVNRIVVRDPTPGSKVAPIILPASSLQPVGFGQEEGMVPSPRGSFLGHRLLMEYFAFPEKFFFVDLAGLSRLREAGFRGVAELVILISEVEGADRLQRLALELSKKNFRLGCAPVVNLFRQLAEPIQLNQRKYEYPLSPDARRPHSIEVFSVDEVTSVNTRTQEITGFEPFYSLRHTSRGRKEQAYWMARRRPSHRPNDEGTDMYLSLVDLSTEAIEPEASILSVRTTCTNRDLPSRLPFGNYDSDFEVEGSSALKRIVALRKPTSSTRPAIGKSALWRLISHLSLNYLSLVQEGREALQQMLRLYDIGLSAYSQNVIEGILRVESTRQFTSLTSEQGITFARGLRIHLELDEDRFAGGGAYLFASVLEQFFGLSTSLNSFTQLVVSTPQRKEILHQWLPRAGRRILV